MGLEQNLKSGVRISQEQPEVQSNLMICLMQLKKVDM